MKRNSRGARERDDAPEITPEQLRRARPMAEVYPGIDQAPVRRRRGKGMRPAKVMVSLRLEQPLIDAYKATGEGWQGRMRETLAAHAPKARHRRSA